MLWEAEMLQKHLYCFLYRFNLGTCGLMLPIGQQRLEKRTQQQTFATAIKDQAPLAQQYCIIAYIQNYYMDISIKKHLVNSLQFALEMPPSQSRIQPISKRSGEGDKVAGK
ncbi:Hypothetical predicted protein [Podarcis lilfordi]|uniref:Uncharacterized protein n=1 Tax=Podarcis lilfordi TaxID=74358 RepID=A0AA35NWB2_9SAUR|nr:Hypothetical predicted protein [Podarcis lilfordi]